MTRKSNTTASLDPFKAWTDFDPAKVNEQFTKLFGDMCGNNALPQINIEPLLDAQRKGLEAMSAASEKALEGARALTQRQAEFARNAVEDSSSAFAALGKAKNPSEALEAQTELARTAFDKAVKDLGELSELVTKTSADVSAPIAARVQESFDEFKAFTATVGK